MKNDDFGRFMVRLDTWYFIVACRLYIKISKIQKSNHLKAATREIYGSLRAIFWQKMNDYILQALNSHLYTY